MSNGRDTFTNFSFPKPGSRGPREKLTAGVPLAKLIKRKLAAAPELVMTNSSRSAAAERFRRLKTVLLNDPEPPQIIVVTSPGPSEGKSLVSINLALTIAAADADGETLLIDADMRRPTLDQWLEPAPKLGLSEYLNGQTELDHVVLELETTSLKILPAGSVPPDPVELLSSAAAEKLIQELRRRCRRVVIDTPPIVPFTDADVLGAMSDGILLVARSGQTRRGLLERAVASVTSTRILGAVLNDTTFSLADHDHRYYETAYYKYYDRARKGKNK
jgi:capsular exopolysaccharide synthesis family protein